MLNADDARVLAMRRAGGGARAHRTARAAPPTSARSDPRSRPPRACASRSPWVRQRARRAPGLRRPPQRRQCACRGGRGPCPWPCARPRSPPASRRRVPRRGAACGGSSGGITILDDTYNANPSSVRAALDTLAAAARRAPAGGRARRHARAGRGRRGGAPGGRARRRRRGRGRVHRGRAATPGPRSRRRAPPGSPRATTRPRSRTRWRPAPEAPGARRRAAREGLAGHAHGAGGRRAHGPLRRGGWLMLYDLLVPARSRITGSGSTSSGTSRSGRRWRR